jgi:two-component system, NarL family, invasion response regulator UvrY
MIRVLIVDDHPIFRSGVRDLLSADPEIDVVAEAASAEDALAKLHDTPTDVILLDISLPGQSGADLLHQLRRETPGVAVLFLSMYPENTFAVPLLRAGASGYLSKTAPPDELIRAVRLAGSGQKYIAPAVAELLCANIGSPAEPTPHLKLSPREMQIFTRIARGLPPSAMAGELSLSVKTIGTYRTRILEKLNLSSNAELAAYAVRNQLLE